MKKTSLLLTTLAVAVLSGCQNIHSSALQIEKQGSFTVGGRYVTHKGTFSQEKFTSSDGQRAYGDFAYVNYQTPVNAKKYPLIFQHGGDATLVHLPTLGIKGNSHFLMGEKNNQQLADLMADWLKEKGLDK